MTYVEKFIQLFLQYFHKYRQIIIYILIIYSIDATISSIDQFDNKLYKSFIYFCYDHRYYYYLKY